MNDYIIEQYERDGYIVTLGYDAEPMHPRDWDHLGTMVCSHRNYRLGDIQVSPYDDYPWEAPDGVAVLIPLGLYDHGGITMYAGGGNAVGDADGWDSGTVGVIYCTKQDIVAWGLDGVKDEADITDAIIDHAKTILLGEIEEYDQYLRGDVYYFMVERRGEVCEHCEDEADPEYIESCHGFYDIEDARSEAESFLPDVTATTV